MISCEVIDVMKLRGQARSLGKLVEIRGREHLDAARAAGKGAILCSAHFGSYNSGFSLLHASGFPLTSVGRSLSTQMPDMSAAERRLWDFVYIRRQRRHRQRPGIDLQPGRVQGAAQAAVVLRANEVLTIANDAPPLDADQARAVEVPFLGQQARLLPGVVTLARLTGAPVLMLFMHRQADYCHQVLEISPPVSMEGDTATAFGRCVAAMDAAIRTNPAHWVYWADTDDLTRLGMLPAAPSPRSRRLRCRDDRRHPAGPPSASQRSSRNGAQPRISKGPARPAAPGFRQPGGSRSSPGRAGGLPGKIRAGSLTWPTEARRARPGRPGPPQSRCRWSSGIRPSAGRRAWPRAR